MEVIDHLERCPHPPEGCVVTIGNFDGVHLGHRAVIDALDIEARRLGAHTAVVSFEPHTLEVIRPDIAPSRLASPERKLELLAETEVDYAMVLAFDDERADQEAEDFVHEVLVGCLHARMVMIGANFRFGHKAGGDIDLLQSMGKVLGFETRPLALVTGAHGAYSSTSIRRAVGAGDMEQAARGLGRPHELRGEVVHGDRRGRTIGFPTVNVVPSPRACLPPNGVFAGRVRLDGEWHDAVVNLGVRPTFRSDPEAQPQTLLEAHILDWTGDAYGKVVDVGLASMLREERRFDGVDALVAQIEDDAVTARRWLARH